MLKNANGGAGLAVILFLAGIALAAANIFALMSLGHGDGGAIAALLQQGNAAPLLAELRSFSVRSPISFAALTLGPIVLGLLAAVAAGRTSTTVAAPVAAPPKPAPRDDSALRLLALLQQEARLIDFIQEDIGTYDDAQVGAAVREIHADCRKALAERVVIERVFAEPEGTDLEIAVGFDPNAIRLTGNVRGEPPFTGTLQHCGWRVVKVSLPASPGDADVRVIAPAEVEIA